MVKLIVKGFIVGFGKIIPGVSGGMLAMMLKIYEPIIYAISHFFRDWKKNESSTHQCRNQSERYGN